MRRFTAPTILLVLAASLALASGAAAELRLPAGADAAPELPPGVIPAEVPPVSKTVTQRHRAGASMSAAKKAFRIQEGPPPLWATVNICDTKSVPNALGVRASVPGNGSGRRVYARFTAQWWSGARQEWLTVGGRGRTDWVYFGSQGWEASQGGWTFHFTQPPAGTAYVVRGIVELSWREQLRASRHQRKRAHWSQVESRVLLTETGQRGVERADPVGASKAMCLIW